MTLNDNRPSEVAAQARAYIRQGRRVFAVSVWLKGGMSRTARGSVDSQIEEELADTIERVETGGWILDRMSAISSAKDTRVGVGDYSAVLVFRRR
ncbi:hypothetical protein [Streptomyces ochraceiscleroticus]|uniref:Resolvase/invertase-type recombinase catalytic domain-containing protein n=1 Tax=Streptomyces ochraceiscleroticus TaxID=47761 RepID=A0ABW1MLI2_9ACTN|nr:hypothetical protein [Streptomyces ochraceiscleroticus]